MDMAAIDRLVNSVLYEGYLLYPYRMALKNAKRFSFGAIFPQASWAARKGTERSATCARLLVIGDSAATVSGQLRFLHLGERVAADSKHLASTWQEAEERRIELGPWTSAELILAECRQTFEFPDRQWREADEATAHTSSENDLVRRQLGLQGSVGMSAVEVDQGVRLLTVSIVNQTPCDESDTQHGGESEALRALISAHLILTVEQAEFVSRIDPPDVYRDLCPSDPGDGLWPVLLGTAGERSAMLCSPIILYDHPEIAPESPADFFDATEMDEMLALRIQTLSDEEKLQVAALDARGRALLRRVDGLAEQQLAALHGVTRSLRMVEESNDGP